MRGFGRGLIWGGAVGFFGLALASQMAPLPPVDGAGTSPDAVPPPEAATHASPAPSASATRETPAGAAVILPAGSEFLRALADQAPALPRNVTAPAAAAAPRLPIPQAPLAPPVQADNPTDAFVGGGAGPSGPAQPAPDAAAGTAVVLPPPTSGKADAAVAPVPVLPFPAADPPLPQP